MRKQSVVRVLLTITVCATAAYTAYNFYRHTRRAHIVCAGGQVLRTEIADTAPARAIGLSGRPQLNDDGLLLIFEHSEQQAIWMKGMRFDLDLLWLDESGRVVHLVNAARRCLETDCQIYLSPTQARFVLEIPAGRAQPLGLTTGAVLHISY
jgi:uncharacterized membrane protein (UPF0127 family)